jgi:hypothetical protein
MGIKRAHQVKLAAPMRLGVDLVHDARTEQRRGVRRQPAGPHHVGLVDEGRRRVGPGQDGKVLVQQPAARDSAVARDAITDEAERVRAERQRLADQRPAG